MAIASDSNNVEVIDLRTEQVVQSLTGHIGFSFSLDWNPSGTLLATGNEDHTCRIFDLRSPTSSLLVLGSRMAAVRNVRYSPDGHVLAVMEESDFVTFYDVPRDYRFSTTVDFFGETAGVDFTPDGEFCYIGCTEPNLGGVIELQRPEIKCLSGLIL